MSPHRAGTWRYMWGSDYLRREGTWPFTADSPHRMTWAFRSGPDWC